MCVICVYEPTKTNLISRTELDAIVLTNPDGFGVMYYENTELKTGKQYNPNLAIMQQIAWDMLQSAEAIAMKNNSYLAIHARIATHGEVCDANCHPFEFANGHMLMHNGILSGYGSTTLSDTEEYARELDYMEAKYPGILGDEIFQDMIGSAISSNKFVIATPTRDITKVAKFLIINEHLGKVDSNKWYSNLNHRVTRFVPNLGFNWDKYVMPNQAKLPIAIAPNTTNNVTKLSRKAKRRLANKSANNRDFFMPDNLSNIDDYLEDSYPMNSYLSGIPNYSICELCKDNKAISFDTLLAVKVCANCDASEYIQCLICNDVFSKLDDNGYSECPSCEALLDRIYTDG